MKQKHINNIEDRIKQLVKDGNRLEAVAVYADRKHISFQEAMEYLDNTYPKEEYSVTSAPKEHESDNKTSK